MINSNFDCLADVVPNRNQNSDYPCLLEEKEGGYIEFYPFEIKNLNLFNMRKMDIYQVPYTNIFTDVDFLRKSCYENHAEIHKYRIREMYDGFGEENFSYSKERFMTENKDLKENLPLKYRFVLSGYSLMTAGNRNCLLLRNPNDMILFDSRQILSKGINNLKNYIGGKIMKKSEEHFQRFGSIIRQFRGGVNIHPERIFQAY